MAYDTENPAFQKGREMRRELFGDAGIARMDAADDFHQPFEEYCTKALFGETWTRPGLSIRERCFITISVAAALNRKVPLERLIRLAVNKGATKDEAVSISSSGKYTKVPLERTLPVYITYFTMGRDINGELRTFEDIYGRDAPVLAAIDAPRQMNRARVTNEEVVEIVDDLQDS